MSKRNEFVALLNVLFCVWVMMTVAVPAFAEDFPHATITAIKMPDTVIVNQPIFIDVTVNNDGGDAKAGGISISLPDNPLVSIIYADTTRATVYPMGSQIWSNTEKKAIPSQHILVEAWQEPWKANEEHHFRLKVMPVKAGTLRLFVRATVTVPKVKRQIIATPDSGPLDQQGFPVKEYTVTVTEPLTRGASQSPNASTRLTVTINQIDAAYYPEVICYVVVTDASDRPIGSLTKANFTVLENEAEQPITSVTPLAIGGGNTVPIDVVLTIDRSGSMEDEGKMSAAITAARTFVDLMQPSDRAKIISFADVYSDHGDFTNAKANLSSIIVRLQPNGQTALYDAVVVSIRALQGRSGRRVAIVLTDGIENASKTTYAALSEVLKKAAIPVYVIGLGNTLDEPVMQQIVWDTGGRYYHAPNAGQLEGLYRSISNQLHQLYVIKYNTSAFLRSGTTHSVMVRANYEGGQAQDVKGYRALVETK